MLDGATRRLPGRDAALQVAGGGEPCVLGRLHGHGRALAKGAVEQEPFAAGFGQLVKYAAAADVLLQQREWYVQSEIEFLHELQIAIDLLQHGIDDQRLAARTAGERVGVGAGCLIEELAENYGATLFCSDCGDGLKKVIG